MVKPSPFYPTAGRRNNIRLKSTGVGLFACKWCPDSYGVSNRLSELGIEVIYYGKPPTQWLKTGWKVLTFQAWGTPGRDSGLFGKLQELDEHVVKDTAESAHPLLASCCGDFVDHHIFIYTRGAVDK